MTKAFTALACCLLFGCVDDMQPGPKLKLTVTSDEPTRTIEDCSEATCELRGGRDSLGVVVEFDDGDIHQTSKLDAPTLELLIDGVKVANPPALAPRELNPRTFESAPWRLPPLAAALTVRVLVVDGYETTLAGLSIQPAVLSLQASCTGAATCQRGLGSANLSATAWVPSATRLRVRSWIDDQPQAVALEPTFESRAGGAAQALFSVPVPQRGTQWRLTGEVDGLAETMPVTLTLTPPMGLGMRVDCADACTPGTTATLTVSVPRDLQGEQAVVYTYVDGRLQPGSVTLALDVLDGDLRVGVAEVALPDGKRNASYRATILEQSVRAEVTLVQPTDAGTDAAP